MIDSTLLSLLLWLSLTWFSYNKMAERQLTFEERFDIELKCSVCLEQYTDPKTLPCLHSFCLKCIEPLPVEIKVNVEKYIMESIRASMTFSYML